MRIRVTSSLLWPKYVVDRGVGTGVFSPLDEPFAARGAALCVPLVTPAAMAGRCKAAPPVDPLERAIALPLDSVTDPVSDAMAGLSRRRRFERRGPLEEGEAEESAPARPWPGEAEPELSCGGEEPDGRLRLPSTWAEERAGLGLKDSIFTVEAEAGSEGGFGSEW